MSNYYAVILANGKRGIFANWNNALAFIRTCPGAPLHKRFSSRDAAKAFISSYQTK